MESDKSIEFVAAFAEELLRTGLMLSEVGSHLVEALPPDAYPGEEPAAVVFEMVVGTIQTALAAVEDQDLARATELMAAARDRVLEHLELALALSQRMHGRGEDGPARTYG